MGVARDAGLHVGKHHLCDANVLRERLLWPDVRRVRVRERRVLAGVRWNWCVHVLLDWLDRHTLQRLPPWLLGCELHRVRVRPGEPVQRGPERERLLHVRRWLRLLWYQLHRLYMRHDERRLR